MNVYDVPESVIAAGFKAAGFPQEWAAQFAEDPNSAFARGIAGAIEAWEAQRRTVKLTPDESRAAARALLESVPVRGVTVTREPYGCGTSVRPVRLTVADVAYVDLSNAEAAQVACELSPDLVGRGDGYSCVNGCAHCCPAHGNCTGC